VLSQGDEALALAAVALSDPRAEAAALLEQDGSSLRRHECLRRLAPLRDDVDGISSVPALAGPMREGPSVAFAPLVLLSECGSALEERTHRSCLLALGQARGPSAVA